MSEKYLAKSAEKYLVDSSNFSEDRIYPSTENDVEFSEVLKQHGLTLQGWYEPEFLAEKKDSPFDPIEGIGLPVVSFRYFKTNKETQEPESKDRVMIWDGEGFGVHPDHKGQDAAQYLAGCQIGSLVDGEIEFNIAAGGRRNFSLDCVVGGDRGETPVDASRA